jgi:molybdopterin converting factor small subunit
MPKPSITIELFGIPRARAGRAEFTVPAATAAEALAALAEACPGLEGLCRADGQLAPQYLLSLDGNRFLPDLAQPLKPGNRLLLLSADPGG